MRHVLERVNEQFQNVYNLKRRKPKRLGPTDQTSVRLKRYEIATVSCAAIVVCP